MSGNRSFLFLSLVLILLKERRVMNTLELKNFLIDQIELSNDQVLLEGLYQFLKTSTDIYPLSDYEKHAIDTSMKDLTAGNTHEHKTVMKDIKEWLDK